MKRRGLPARRAQGCGRGPAPPHSAPGEQRRPRRRYAALLHSERWHAPPASCPGSRDSRAQGWWGAEAQTQTSCRTSTCASATFIPTAGPTLRPTAAPASRQMRAAGRLRTLRLWHEGRLTEDKLGSRPRLQKGQTHAAKWPSKESRSCR